MTCGWLYFSVNKFLPYLFNCTQGFYSHIKKGQTSKMHLCINVIVLIVISGLIPYKFFSVLKFSIAFSLPYSKF